ncbi:hypothetical protein C8R47DRAFT_1228631 [Mycena vitilis]|nr:hypothetical protein C8R47DRAFT_1228631 [Mycena vitilis]
MSDADDFLPCRTRVDALTQCTTCFPRLPRPLSVGQNLDRTTTSSAPRVSRKRAGSTSALPCLSDTSGVTGDYSPMPASAPYITSRTSFHASLADTIPPSGLSAQLAPSATSALLLARFYPT